MKPVLVFRLFFWAFLLAGSAAFWGWLFWFRTWTIWILIGIAFVLAAVAYYFIQESKRYPF